MGTAGDLGFNTVKLDQRLAELYRDKKQTVKGNFRWKDGVKDNQRGVEFVEDSLNGKFLVSNLMAGQTNKWKWTPNRSVWDEKKGEYVYAKMPLNPMLTTAGADPFDYGTKPDSKTHSMMSDGGIYVMTNFDEVLDGGKKKEDQQTNITICTYRHRPPSLEEYCEDVIMCMVYFQAMLSVERNKSRLWEYIIDRGYGGYLIYIQNSDGTINKEPGLWTGQGKGSKDLYLNVLRDYIDDHIWRDKHYDLIQELKDITSPDKMRFFDLLTACAVARVGAMYGHQRALKRISDRTVISLKNTQFAKRRIY